MPDVVNVCHHRGGDHTRATGHCGEHHRRTTPHCAGCGHDLTTPGHEEH